jgi:hypothetical protein
MFGLSSAPRDFSVIIKKFLELSRNQVIRCCFFIHDITSFARSEQQGEELREITLGLLYKLWFRVAWPRSVLRPGQVIRHLGLDVCSTDGLMWAPEDKIMRLKQLAAELLQTCSCPVLGGVSYFCGGAGSIEIGNPSGPHPC